MLIRQWFPFPCPFSHRIPNPIPNPTVKKSIVDLHLSRGKQVSLQGKLLGFQSVVRIFPAKIEIYVISPWVTLNCICCPFSIELYRFGFSRGFGFGCVWRNRNFQSTQISNFCLFIYIIFLLILWECCDCVQVVGICSEALRFEFPGNNQHAG